MNTTISQGRPHAGLILTEEVERLYRAHLSRVETPKEILARHAAWSNDHPQPHGIVAVEATSDSVVDTMVSTTGLVWRIRTKFEETEAGLRWRHERLE